MGVKKPHYLDAGMPTFTDRRLMAELKNGRLAMIAVASFFAQSAIPGSVPLLPAGWQTVALHPGSAWLFAPSPDASAAMPSTVRRGGCDRVSAKECRLSTNVTNVGTRLVIK